MLQIFLSSHMGIELYNLIGLKSQRVPFELPFYLCSKNMSSREHQYASVFPVYGKLMNFHDFSITFPSCYCWTKKLTIMFIQASSLMNHSEYFAKKDSLKSKIHNTYISTACKKIVLYTKAMQFSNSMIFP